MMMQALELSHHELEQQHGVELPARRMMALVNFNTIVATNTAVALNVLSENSLAAAFAGQFIAVSQS